MITERFRELRRKELSDVFTKQNIARVWRKIVRDQLRKVSDIIDLFDYYDLNYNIEERALIIRAEILNGDYECSKPLIYRIEKKFGVCRHIIVPQPVDALILQILTERLRREIIKQQPSPNAFYAREKHNVRRPHEIEEYGLHWRELWKKLQKLIYNFRTSKELLIVTDLTNYYDSIDISILRKMITGYVEGKEVLIDLLFHIIEKITWCPDYLPYSGRGLPTTNIEAVRLLGHSFLFELDTILCKKTDNSFARWMDDMVIGVDLRQDAIEVLSSASDVLKSRGLALHLAKTDIYDVRQAEYHFQIDSNKYLDSIEKYLDPTTTPPMDLDCEVLEKLKVHLKDRKPKYWEKVTKRYITVFGKLRSPLLLELVPELYSAIPAVRPNLLIFLSNLGYSDKTTKTVLKVIQDLAVFDDISLYQVCRLVTEWNVPVTTKASNFLRTFQKAILEVSKRRKQPFDFFCLLWLKTKYASPQSLSRFIEKYANIWRTSPFLRRQVTASMARILPIDDRKARSFLEAQMSTGTSQIASLANQILLFSSAESLEERARVYLFQDPKPRAYPLYKFLILCSFLNSKSIRDNEKIRDTVADYLEDNYYLHWVNKQYGINRE